MNTAYLNAIAAAGASSVTHISLVNGSGVEVATARKPVTWTAPVAGLIRPNADLVFDLQAGDVVSAWKGHSALTGGTDYDGADLADVTFGNDGTYTLQAASTGIQHSAV